MKYKVVKEFDSMKKGEILDNKEDADIFTFEEETDNSYRFISYSSNIIADLLDKGYLVEINEESTKTSELEDLICKTIDEIDSLIEQYEKDNQEVTDKVANNELPYCVKVEADTVHANLTKVLTHIKDMLLENE